MRFCVNGYSFPDDGARMVTMLDVAKRAEVSIGTVSRYVNGSGYVGPAARERIGSAITQLGFVPNRAARSLTTKQTGLLGFVVSALGNPFNAELAAGLQDKAHASGYSVVVSATDNTATDNEERMLRALSTLRGHNVDGLVVTPPETPAINQYLVSAVNGGTPVVLIGMRLDPPVADRVTTATYDGARAAIAHLLALGHRRIGFVGGARIAAGRRRGYVDSLHDAGIPVDPVLLVEGALNREGGIAGALRLLDLADPPTAVFAANDETALGVVQAAYLRRLRVPDELSVVGFDDVGMARHAVPPLTTVAQPKQQMGHEAVDLLLARIGGDPPAQPVEVRLPCTLVVRDSTAPPARSPA